MIKIAHRGNITGKSDRENHPSYIKEALLMGYDAEIDVWYLEYGGYFLGHDKPEHPVDLKFLTQKGLWLHCKDRATYESLSKYKKLNIFRHTESEWKKGYPARTSKGYIWMYPEVYSTEGNLYAKCGDNLFNL